MEFLGKKMMGFHFIIQPVVLLGIGLVISGLNSSPIKMAKDSLVFESPFQANSEDHPVRAIGLEFGDRGEGIDIGHSSHFGEMVVIRVRKIFCKQQVNSEQGGAHNLI